MWAVDPTGSYKFSDRSDPKQKLLLDYSDTPTWVSAAANLVFKKFAGERSGINEIKKFIVTETPYLFRKKLILKKLEDEGKITEVIGRRRRGTFPDGCVIKFSEL
jgi:hypothetical protein